MSASRTDDDEGYVRRKAIKASSNHYIEQSGGITVGLLDTRHPTALVLFPIVVAFVAATVHLLFGIQDHVASGRILEQGSRTVGTVTDVTPCRVEYCEVYEYRFRYNFTTPNQVSFTGSQVVQGRSWSELQTGDIVKVAFDPSDPTNNRLVARGVRPLWHIGFFTMLIAALAFVGSNILAWKLANRWVWPWPPYWD